MAKKTPALAEHRYSAALTGAGKAFDLKRFDPAAKPFSSGDKAADKLASEALAGELDGLQNLFYADKRFKLLVVLQGTDTSGKDGTLRGVFGKMSALGVHTVGWKAPTEPERAHDYLWRIHAQVPSAGEVMVFKQEPGRGPPAGEIECQRTQQHLCRCEVIPVRRPQQRRHAVLSTRVDIDARFQQRSHRLLILLRHSVHQPEIRSACHRQADNRK